MRLRKTTVALLAGSLIAGCSVDRLPIPSAPPGSPDSSAAVSTPAADFDGLPAGLNRRMLATAEADRWLVGTLADGWQRLGVGLGDASVDDTWGRIAVTSTRGGEIVVSILDDSGALREAYRTRDDADATTGASQTPDGSGLIVFNTSLGLRHVDLGTGRATDVFAPGHPFPGPKTTGEAHWSASGRMLAFVVCDGETCQSQVAEGYEPRAVVDNFVPGAIAGHWLVGYERQGVAAPLLLDIETGGRRRVAPAIEAFWDAIALSESRFLLWGTRADGQFAFALVDLTDGTDHVVALDPQIRHPFVELSTSDWAALGPMDNLWVPVGGSLDVLDFASGRFFQDVIAVPPAP